MCTSIFIYSTSLESLVETHPLILYVQFSEPPDLKLKNNVLIIIYTVEGPPPSIHLWLT